MSGAAKEHERVTAEAGARLSTIHAASKPGTRKKLGLSSADIAWALQLLRRGDGWAGVVKAVGAVVEPGTLEAWRPELERLAAATDEQRMPDGPQVAGAPRWPR